MNILETKDLKVSLGKQVILKEISLQVPQGSIYGFLGVNGAGKTTCIRTILSLIKPDKGEVNIFESSVQSNRSEVLSKVGCLIEQPILYEHLTGLENLELNRIIANVSEERVGEVLELVNMTYAANKRVSKYSLGMKQRIGIALALLSDPDLLILDEPTNGLDPSGIHEMRELIIRLNKDFGKTIFISSHLLSEIEKLSTHVGILHGGELIFQGTLNQLKNANNETLQIQLKNANNAALLLNKNGHEVVNVSSGELQLKLKSTEIIPSMIKTLVESGYEIFGVSRSDNNLEHVFLNLTN